MQKAIETKQIRCCIYARVSTEEQAERDLSIPFQLERCRYHAKGIGWEVAREFVDAGESARTDKRPDFQKMITAARAREFDVILVHKFDRFARNDYDFVVYEKELGESGITLESVSEPGDASTPAGYIGRRMMQIISTWYSKNLAVEVKKGLIKSVENGGWPRRAPFGYLNKRDKSSAWIEVDSINSHFVTDAFKEMATGKWTLESWAEQAYSLGCRSREGNRISRMKWSEIFHHRFYLGETWLKFGDIPVKGKQPPLVDETTFAMVQQVLKEHDKHRQRTHHHQYLLRGLVRSVEANSPCSVETNNKKHISYYRSREKVNGKQVFYNTRTIEKQLPAVLSEVAISEEGRQDLRKYIAKFFTNENETVSEVKNAEARLAKLERMEKNLQVLFMEEGISQKDFREHRAQIEAERSKLTNTVNIIKQRQHLVKADFEIALDLCAQLDWLWQKSDFDGKRLLCETIFKEIRVEGGKIAAVVFNSPFAMIAAYVRGHGSATVGDGGDRGIRTPDLCDANAALSRLSYIPTTRNYNIFRRILYAGALLSVRLSLIIQIEFNLHGCEEAGND
jgi:site-specific DNA recombinase